MASIIRKLSCLYSNVSFWCTRELIFKFEKKKNAERPQEDEKQKNMLIVVAYLLAYCIFEISKIDPLSHVYLHMKIILCVISRASITAHSVSNYPVKLLFSVFVLFRRLVCCCLSLVHFQLLIFKKDWYIITYYQMFYLALLQPIAGTLLVWSWCGFWFEQTCLLLMWLNTYLKVNTGVNIF